MKKIKLAIGMITAGSVKADTVFCLFRMFKALPFECIFIFKEGCLIHWNREHIAKTALKEGCTHLLFIDSDMHFEADAVLKLLERNKDIVGVHYNLRKFPLTTTVHMDLEKKKNLKESFTTCDSVAAGFMLIRTDVFRKLDEPWFFFESNQRGEVKTGEDYWFCRKAREAGYDIWVDLTVPVTHIGNYFY